MSTFMNTNEPSGVVGGLSSSTVTSEGFYI